jgi:hypothetical protein
MPNHTERKVPLIKGVRGLYQKKIIGMKSLIKRNTMEKCKEFFETCLVVGL